ncbi:MAG: ATP-binding cassette domain-containing protein [Acholeplasmataceae bacterium]|nr:ATP-binding cassette domain-containing protein [Acholeplasmataceae bacterium]
MSLLDVTGLTFNYADGELYNNASLRLFEGEHAVLVGPNGTGKTTLLKLLDRELKPDTGEIRWMPGKKIGYLDQYAKIDQTLTVRAYLYDVFMPLFDKEREMLAYYDQVAHVEGIEQARLLERASVISDDLLASDFYAMKSKIGNVIHGLGLDMEILDTKIKTLSGGMRAKIILGKLLLEEADVLLLDEPTNFLDVRHIDWLAKFLSAYPKAFIVVSHQEDFLERIAKTVFAIEGKKVSRYKGDYDFYLKERVQRFEAHHKAFVAQQKKISETELFIKKNIVRDSTTKRAQSRRKMLEKMERIEPPHKSRTYKFHFPMASSTGRDVLKTEDLEIGYDGPLVEPITMTIMKEDKVALTGRNGIGKSTFVKTILSRINALGGTFEWIDTAKIAYFEQENSFDETMTPFTVVHGHYPAFSKKEVMSLLGNHGIDYDMANRPMGSLSGGEQTKVRLALLRHQKGNVLILDEPTNHLDYEAKEALKSALLAYQGTLILVSHDSQFYQDLCDYEIQLYETND